MAAFACRRFFNFETTILCHYGSFPVIDQTAGMEGSGTKALVPEIGRLSSSGTGRRPMKAIVVTDHAAGAAAGALEERSELQGKDGRRREISARD